MNYTILKQWKTVDESYHSSTIDKKDWISAIVEFHNKFKPMVDDTNVQSFTFSIIDEVGKVAKRETFERPQPITEEEPSEEQI